MFHPKGPTFWELVVQCLSSTERGYDLLAPKFDYTPFRTPEVVLKVLAEQIGSARRLLDVCCGTGVVMAALRDRCSREVVGIDFSQGMLNIAHRRMEAMSSSVPYVLVRGDCLEMNFESEFDLVVCCGALGHILIEDQPRFLQCIHRSLQKGGRFVFVTVYRPPWWSLKALKYRIFNMIMWLRNRFLNPPFIMYYFTFVLPDIIGRLELHGFEVKVKTGLFPHPYEHMVYVEAEVK